MIKCPPARIFSVALAFAIGGGFLCAGTTTGLAAGKKRSSKHNAHSSSRIPVHSGGSVLYAVQPGYSEVGVASWYGGRDVGRKTANGETYRPTDVTAAHKRLPFNTLVRVTNLNNGKSTVVRINDRGPYIRGRIIDLSESSARRIDVYDRGVSKVKIEVVKAIPIMERPNLRVPSTFSSPQPTPKKRS